MDFCKVSWEGGRVDSPPSPASKMGIEFQAKQTLNMGPSTWNNLVKAIEADGFNRIELSSHSASFVLTADIQTDWKEDIVLDIADGVYVVFHGGTGKDRERFLRSLESNARRFGLDIEMEEV